MADRSTYQHPDLARLRAGFADPPRSAAPMMRWWWFGPAITREGIERDLTSMADAGLGGAEIAYVYPMAVLDEPDPFLGPDFLAHLDHAVRFGTSLGLRVDLTLGSGWSFGGPHITQDLAARTLHWDRRTLPPGPHRLPLASVTHALPDDTLPGTTLPGDTFVAAFCVSLEGPPDPVPLNVIDGHLTIPDARHPRQLLVATSRPTGQNVKRAASGAEGLVLDHYRADAVRAHLRSVGDVLLDAVDVASLGSVFCDSLEVYDASWTPALPAEFEARRGYPLLPRLAELVLATPGSPGLRADLHRTLTELYEENFVDEVCAWAADRGVAFRLQGYGVPPASVSSWRDVDGIEGEGWGWRSLTSAKWASSAAHERGTPVVSAEAWTWVNSPSFRASPLDLVGEAHEHLLAGVNQFVGHGWPHCPADAPGIGPVFYASGALDDRNAWWPAAPSLWRYLTRLSWLLRQGEPVRDVTLLVPRDDVYAGLAPELDLYRAIRRHVGDEIPAALRTAGHDYVLVDDAIADEPPRSRPAIVVVGTPDARTATWLAAQERARSHVIPVGQLDADGHAPQTDGTSEVDGTGRGAQIGVEPDVAIDGGGGEVGSVHRRVGDADLWFVANTGPHERAIAVRPRDAAARLERWDAHSGGVTATWAGTSAELTLAPYEAAVLVATASPDTPATSSTEPPSAQTTCTQLTDWRVRVGDDERPVTLPHRWEDDPALARFCGTVTYTADFTLPTPDTLPSPSTPPRTVLDLGPTRPADGAFLGDAGLPSFRAAVAPPVGAVVAVTVNDTPCGVLFTTPFSLDVTDAVRPGTNRLTLAVSSTSAHALADDERLAATVAAVERRYGRRFVLQDVAHADAGVASGLLGAPVLRVT